MKTVESRLERIVRNEKKGNFIQVVTFNFMLDHFERMKNWSDRDEKEFYDRLERD